MKTGLNIGHESSYLAEFLLERGYTVRGNKRCASSLYADRVDHIFQDLHFDDMRSNLHCSDVSHGISIECKTYLEAVGK